MADPILVALIGASAGSAVTWLGLRAQVQRWRMVSITLRQRDQPAQVVYVDPADPRLFLYVRDGVIHAARELMEGGR